MARQYKQLGASKTTPRVGPAAMQRRCNVSILQKRVKQVMSIHAKVMFQIIFSTGWRQTLRHWGGVSYA